MRCYGGRHVFNWQSYGTDEPMPDTVRCWCGRYSGADARRIVTQNDRREQQQQHGGEE